MLIFSSLFLRCKITKNFDHFLKSCPARFMSQNRVPREFFNPFSNRVPARFVSREVVSREVLLYLSERFQVKCTIVRKFKIQFLMDSSSLIGWCWYGTLNILNIHSL